jgi:hypothetical protein
MSSPAPYPEAIPVYPSRAGSSRRSGACYGRSAAYSNQRWGDPEISLYRERTIALLKVLRKAFMRKPGHAERELSALRQEITALVSQNAVVMVQNAIDAVNEGGQYQAIKYLFEMIGLYPPSGDEYQPGESSLATILLEQLGIEDAASKAKSRVRKKSAVDPVQ